MRIKDDKGEAYGRCSINCDEVIDDDDDEDGDDDDEDEKRYSNHSLISGGGGVLEGISLNKDSKWQWGNRRMPR